ncbi:HASPIN protein kinase [Helicocarpus griseus UAMH5409]|uniref:non-specific serine/threonine protein kinase n=1 Tax=Helicocarpus griseus UAMH5409 TaxID=1447875 RepID=A0A2B7X1A0_9EURO|nr:HASPIN protein kinase [Helicocarpus griseus UAMH5409]
MSLFSPSSSASTKKLPRSTFTKSTTAATGANTRRVYGKRTVNAPRAVLERENNRAPKTALKIQSQGVEDDVDGIAGDFSALKLGIDAEKKDVKEEKAGTIKELDRLGKEEVRTNVQPMVEVRIVHNHVQRNVGNSGETGTVNPSSFQKEEVSKPKRKPRRSSGWIQDVKLNDYVQPILSEATSSISSRGIQSFASWARRGGDMFTVEKIAEGSYGEVYQLRFTRDISQCNLSKSRLARLKAYKDGVFKIIPLRAQRGVGSKKFTTVQEIVSEVQLLKLLDPIPGFARFREVHVVQGRFPETYQEAWTRYSQTNDDCLNPDPSKEKSYPDTQLWAILEMDNAGHELEKFAWSSAFQVYDIFWGVALALARAEQFAAFEHRDLHLGNICIKPRKHRDGLAQLSRLGEEGLDGCLTAFGLSGLETTIIDYSLSRAELQPVDEEAKETKNSAVEIAWSDLDKKQIFDAIGRDEDEKLLRDTYRCMRSEVYHQVNLLIPPEQQPPTKTGQWKHYNPRTNLVWLSFLLQMLLKKHKPATTERPEQQKQRQPLTPRPANRKLDNTNSNTSKASKKIHGEKKGGADDGSCLVREADSKNANSIAQQLEEELTLRLQTMADLLDVSNGIEGLYCAGDLVALAIGSGWLGEGDFMC